MTADQQLENYFTNAEMAKLLGIKESTLDNKVSNGEDLPPFFGRGKARRFPRDEFLKWEKSRLKMSRSR